MVVSLSIGWSSVTFLRIFSAPPRSRSTSFWMSSNDFVWRRVYGAGASPLKRRIMSRAMFVFF